MPTRTALVSVPELVRNAGKLFTLPDICLQLQSLIDSPSTNSDQIARLIASDPALTARILKVANSAFYAFPGSVDSVSLAITLLGTQEVHNLVIATSAAQLFKTSGGGLIDMADFRTKSILVGLVNQALGEMSKKPHQPSGFVAGLLHDIGRLLVFEQIPHLAASAVLVVDPRQPYWEREQDVLGYTFADAGGYLLREWRLPALVTEPVTYQHQPRLTPQHSIQAAILCISTNACAHALKPSLGHPDYMACIEDESLQTAGITVEAGKWIVQEMLVKVALIADIFFGK